MKATLQKKNEKAIQVTILADFDCITIEIKDEGEGISKNKKKQNKKLSF
jgi:sensor histidine kinase YesM